MRVVQISKEKWAELAEKAHLIVFNEKKDPKADRIDFALIVESTEGVPMQYTTCRELDSESIYFQYGGSFPGTKGTPQSLLCMEKLMEWARFQGYRRITCLIENTNQPALKSAMKCGFLITGVRNFHGQILLDHIKEPLNG